MLTPVVSSPAETTVVGSSNPFKTITDPATNPVPRTRIGNDGCPIATVFGSSAVRVGAGGAGTAPPPLAYQILVLLELLAIKGGVLRQRRHFLRPEIVDLIVRDVVRRPGFMDHAIERGGDRIVSTVAMSPPYYAPYVATVYWTAPVRAFFQLMNRSARKPIKLFCQNDVMTVVASAGLSGAESICTDASRLASIVTPPSSA